MTTITHRHGSDRSRPGVLGQVALLVSGRGRVVRRGPAPGQDTTQFLLSSGNRERLLRSIDELNGGEGREHDTR
ncbi:hypothetical protein C5C31_00705 [Rathayibacter rathayi]|uniref:Uncharacterized protein n=1 Tax=Rathayibacter rathayi TaxID=33887 RepID=A0ABD6WCP8_RATRA|nr:hypothetical protein [Rathayibacter rathayi]AZZ49266.1 hypothetical protein C1O28_08675 [Rathayibacter rathayi]MWV73341.1 hypothetical protein [Rathayibacter rathayi NCPPB 2980 = VKM Ac-1601]PPF16413.1 hypothetical protein C5C04_01150 [Rathayibacter rathayi]PPF25682.1 hypothetical protein C5C34_02455 [Rathayibacter rathayi]PPF52004.1 hypothetical protein C5C08_01235 [Rathayibacter rathayi]